MQKALRILTLCTLALCSSAAHSDASQSPANSAFRILSACESREDFKQTACIYYIGGVIGTIKNMDDLLPKSPVPCLPEQLTWGQGVKMFEKYANDHPENLHYQAASVIQMMFLEAFPGPCSKE
jgi:hypothetical protein